MRASSSPRANCELVLRTVVDNISCVVFIMLDTRQAFVSERTYHFSVKILK